MNDQVPAHILARQNRRNITAAVVAGLGSASPPYVSIKGNMFTLIDSNGEQVPIKGDLDCVIFDVNEKVAIQRVFWGKDRPFDPNSDTYQAPECFSDNGVGASVNAQHPQSTNCSSCQWNTWGSAVSKVSGKATKACGQIKKVVVLVPGYTIPFLLRVPVMSHEHLRAYASKFNGQAFDTSDVVTRVSFVHGQVGQIELTAVGFADADVIGLADKLLAEKATDALVGRGDVAIQGQLPAPQPVAQAALQQPQQAPTQAAPSPVFGQPAEAAPKQTRTRKPKAEPALAPTSAPFAPAPQPTGEQIPAFLRREPAAQAAPFAATATPAVQHGIQTDAPPPNAEMAAALDSLFGKANG